MWKKRDRKVVRWAKVAKMGTLVVEMIEMLKAHEQPVVTPAETTVEIMQADSEKIVGIVTSLVLVIGKMNNKGKTQIVIMGMEMLTLVDEEEELLVDPEVAEEGEDKVFLVVECNLMIQEDNFKLRRV